MSLGVREDLHVPVGLLARLADSQQLACTPSGCVFVAASAREGVLPRMLREVCIPIVYNRDPVSLHFRCLPRVWSARG
jgi:hypothetical protein